MSVEDGWVAIGAMTREYVAEESGTVAEAVPLLAAALPMIGHEAIRSRGTIGGSWRMPIRPPSCRPWPGRSTPSSWCAARRGRG